MGFSILLSNRIFLIGLIVALCLVIFIADLYAPLGVAGDIAFILPIFIASRLPGIKTTIWIASVCSIMTLVGLFDHLSLGINKPWIVLVNHSLLLFIVWMAAWLVIRNTQVKEALQRYELIINATDDYMVLICMLD